MDRFGCQSGASSLLFDCFLAWILSRARKTKKMNVPFASDALYRCDSVQMRRCVFVSSLSWKFLVCIVSSANKP